MKLDPNSPKYHTGKPCIEAGCDKPAGTAWSPLWCAECNKVRVARISNSLQSMLDILEKRKPA